MNTTTESQSTKGEFERVAEGLIRSRTSDIFYSRFRHEGKVVRKSLKTTHQQTAKKRLRRLRCDLESGKVSPLSRPAKDEQRASMTLSTLVERYVAIAIGKAVSTAKRSETYAKSLLAHMGDTPIDLIRTSQIEMWLVKATDTKKPSTYNEYLRVARQVFDIGVKDGVIEMSPADTIGWRPRSTPDRPTPSEKEVEEIIAYLRAYPRAEVRHVSADLVEFMAFAGMGQGEVRSLRWKDIDFDSGKMSIVRQKTKKRFSVHFNPRVEVLLRRRFSSGKNRDELVFASADPKRVLASACKALELRPYSPRALRRFFCTRAIRLGIDPTTVGHWQGHRDGKLILEIYGNSKDEQHSKEMARLMA